MNEAEWNTCTDPMPMLEFLRDSGNPSERKLRLFAGACCRRAWHVLDANGRATVEASERFADGLASQEEVKTAIWANRSRLEIDARSAVDYAAVGAWRPVVALLGAVCGRPPGSDPSSPVDPAAMALEHAAQATLLRDAIGNPFQAMPTFDPALLAWNDGQVVKLAQAAYDDRLLPSGELDPVRLSILCDGLLDAGCPVDDELLLHLQGTEAHIRGCVAIDLLLARSDLP